jgi:hypothetical protein
LKLGRGINQVPDGRFFLAWCERPSADPGSKAGDFLLQKIALGLPSSYEVEGGLNHDTWLH